VGGEGVGLGRGRNGDKECLIDAKERLCCIGTPQRIGGASGMQTARIDATKQRHARTRAVAPAAVQCGEGGGAGGVAARVAKPLAQLLDL